MTRNGGPMYRDQVRLRERTGQTAAGVDTYETDGVTYLAHVVDGPRQVRTPEGEVREAHTLIRLAPFVVDELGNVDRIMDIPLYTPEAELTLIGRTTPSGAPLQPVILTIGATLDHLGRRAVEITV